MISEESAEKSRDSKEFLKRRRKATRIGLRKLKRQEEKKAQKEQEDIERRPYHSFEAVELTRRRAREDDLYDLETLFL